MGIVARIVHAGRVLVLTLCAAGMTAAVLLTATSALAGPRLFGTVEFQMDLKKQQNWLSVKYYTLKALGISPDRMRIVVVRETIRNIGHAVLAVYDGEEVYILDNLSDAVRPMERIRNYVPQFSVNEKHRWVHVRARR